MTLSRMAGGSHQALSLKFRAPSLFDPFLDKFRVPSAGDFHAIAKMKEDIFYGFFG